MWTSKPPQRPSSTSAITFTKPFVCYQLTSTSLTQTKLASRINHHRHNLIFLLLAFMIICLQCLEPATSLQLKPKVDRAMMTAINWTEVNVARERIKRENEIEEETNVSDEDYYDGMPTSFAVLINFGLDGQQRSLYSSFPHKERCRQGQIWDPFNGQCRQLFCHDNYKLTNFTCYEKPNGSTAKPNLKFLDTASEFINVTLFFRLNETKSMEWVRDNQNMILYEFTEKFATSWSIDDHRVIDIDLSYKEEAALMEIHFLLADDGAKYPIKADTVLKPLSDAIVKHKLRYTLVGVSFIALHIHTTVAEVNNFCMREVDMPIWYWNDEFTLFSRGNLTYLYSTSTGRIYYPGEFMGSVLYVENGSGKNVSSNAVVCEQTLIDATCPQTIYNRSEYEFVDGRHLYTSDGFYHERYELSFNASLFTCLERTPEGVNAKIQSILSLVLMIISITLLTIMLITFVRLESIRKTVNGFNTINLVLCLGVMQITFLANQYIDYCGGTASVFHFFILTTISWSCVIAYDMYQVFARKKNLLLARKNTSNTRITYGLVAYMLPLTIVGLAKLSDVFHLSAIAADYGRVAHSSNFCWMRARRALIIYFIVPVAIAQVFNLVLYLCIICNIRSNIRSFTSFRKMVVRIPSGSSQTSTLSVISSSTAGATSRSSSEQGGNISSTSEVKLNYNQTSIYTKLSVPLGFTWAIALFSPLVPVHQSVVIMVMSYLFILANTSQGVVLFFAFGVYRKVFARNNPK